jgi:glycosyltransferase involved in cell wall biosynthesis
LQFNSLATTLEGNLCVIYYQRIEPNRNWEIPVLEHKALFCKRTIFSRINFYPDIFGFLVKEKPQIIIATGFTSTVLFVFLYARLTKKKFIVFTDSWLHPVSRLKTYHRLIRRIIIPNANASICVGSKGKEYLEEYGAKRETVFISPLAIRNEFYFSFYQPVESKEFDIIFSGQFVDRKMPFFVIDVLKELKIKKDNIRFLIIGSGPLEKEILKQLKDYKIEYSYPGFIQQEDLPKYYANAKVLAFPTRDDPWGLVANEACAVGTPVITCENAGASDDLVVHNFNGFVLPLSVDIWVEHIFKLLSDIELYITFSENSIKHIKQYSIENATRGIKDAIYHLLTNDRK